MSRRTLLFLVVALAMAALCIRLGLWQLGRLGDRRAANALVEARTRESPVPIGELLAAGADPASLRFRRVSVRGTYEYDRELAIGPRTRQGSPGVNILTPVVTGDGTRVLVNRGWVYSPDGSTVDLARWREGEPAHVTGFVETFAPADDARPVGASNRTRVIRRAVRDSIAARVGAALAPVYVVELQNPAATPLPSQPARLEPPPLDEGPHFSYAMQWFAFAAIGVVGGIVVAMRERRVASR